MAARQKTPCPDSHTVRMVRNTLRATHRARTLARLTALWPSQQFGRSRGHVRLCRRNDNAGGGADLLKVFFSTFPIVRRVKCLNRSSRTGRYFLCRGCYGLSYGVQRERGMDRALRKANKTRMKLGGEPAMDSFFPDKPKDMHWRTYQRLVLEVANAEAEANELFAARAGRLLGRVSAGKEKGFWT